MKEKEKILKLYKQKGLNGVEGYIKLHERYRGEDHRYYLLVNKNWRVIAGDLKGWPSDFKVGKSVQNIWVSEDDIVGKVEDGDGYWPMIGIRFKGGAKLLIAQGVAGTEDLRETLFAIIIVIFAFIVLLTLFLGFLLGKSMLSQVENIKEVTSNIVKGNLSVRVPISKRNDEFDVLGEHINYMLNELESFILQSKESARNITHNLKTPLSVIRNKVEELTIEDGGVNISKKLKLILDDIDRTTSMLDSILNIYRVETGAVRKNWERLDLSKVVDEVVEFYQPLAEEKGIEIKIEKLSSGLIMGQKQLILQAISNILDNAIKYTSPNTLIKITIDSVNGSTLISICDRGSGVKQEDFNKITKEFVRLDNAKDKPGFGLGLSFVRAVAEFHNAKLEFEDNNPGLCVSLIFKKRSLM